MSERVALTEQELIAKMKKLKVGQEVRVEYRLAHQNKVVDVIVEDVLGNWPANSIDDYGTWREVTGEQDDYFFPQDGNYDTCEGVEYMSLSAVPMLTPSKRTRPPKKEKEAPPKALPKEATPKKRQETSQPSMVTEHEKKVAIVTPKTSKEEEDTPNQVVEDEETSDVEEEEYPTETLYADPGPRWKALNSYDRIAMAKDRLTNKYVKCSRHPSEGPIIKDFIEIIENGMLLAYAFPPLLEIKEFITMMKRALNRLDLQERRVEGTPAHKVAVLDECTRASDMPAWKKERNEAANVLLAFQKKDLSGNYHHQTPRQTLQEQFARGRGRGGRGRGF